MRARPARTDESGQLAGQAGLRRSRLATHPAARVRPALGDRGISGLERLVEQRAQTADPQSWCGGFAVRDLREQLAEVSGDLDRYVDVLAEHLTSTIQYERITLALRAAGRRVEAIDWARRGLAAKPGWPHADQLRDTLVDMLLEEGSTEAALAVRRAEFQRRLSFPRFLGGSAIWRRLAPALR